MGRLRKAKFRMLLKAERTQSIKWFDSINTLIRSFIKHWNQCPTSTRFCVVEGENGFSRLWMRMCLRKLQNIWNYFFEIQTNKLFHWRLVFEKSNMFIWSTWDAKDGVTQPAITNKLIISKKKRNKRVWPRTFSKVKTSSDTWRVKSNPKTQPM